MCNINFFWYALFAIPLKPIAFLEIVFANPAGGFAFAETVDALSEMFSAFPERGFAKKKIVNAIPENIHTILAGNVVEQIEVLSINYGR